MNTIMFLAGLIVIIIAIAFSIYYEDSIERNSDKFLAASVIAFFMGVLISVIGIANWFTEGEPIKADLLKNKNIVFLSDKDDDNRDLFHLLPPLKKKLIVIEDGRDIEYYEIIENKKEAEKNVQLTIYGSEK